jgi:hypothetical protein
VNEYTTNAYEMLLDISRNSVGENRFNESFEIDTRTWTMAAECVANKPVIQRIGKSDEYIFCSKHKDDIQLDKNLIANKLDRVTLDFDAFIKHCQKYRKIRLNRENWALSTCSCAFGMKNYYCYHVITVAVMEKLAVIPVEKNGTRVVPNAAKGRKAKAPKALKKQ